ncbi:MAG TPA: hypothetical protein PKY07_07390, partial [Aliarcobacter cryaerophilus]|nr:hypothetical protein [Aliarcobacter cryaerophilus]
YKFKTGGLVMLRFLLGVVAGFAAKKYYDENKEQVDKKFKKIVEIVDNDSVKNSDKKCCENSDNNTIQAVEVVR